MGVSSCVSITRMKASVALAFALFAIVGSVVTADFSDDFEDDFVADQAEFVQNEADATPMVTTAVKKPLSGKQRGQIWKTIAPAKGGGYSKKDEEKMKAAKQQKKAKKQAKKAVVKLSPAARARIYHRLHPGKSATLAQVTRCNHRCHRHRHKKSRAHCYTNQSACHCRNWHNKRAVERRAVLGASATMRAATRQGWATMGATAGNTWATVRATTRNTMATVRATTRNTMATVRATV